MMTLFLPFFSPFLPAKPLWSLRSSGRWGRRGGSDKARCCDVTARSGLRWAHHMETTYYSTWPLLRT